MNTYDEWGTLVSTNDYDGWSQGHNSPFGTSLAQQAATEAEKERRVQRKNLPAMHGAPWNGALDSLLCNDLCLERKSVEEVAREMHRLPTAIEARAVKLGFGTYDAKNRFHLVGEQPKKAKEKSVNFNHLITLLQRDYTTVDVVFTENSDGKHYTYKIHNSMLTNVGVDTLVVVPVYTNGNFKVAKVVYVHDEPEIDIRAPYALKWVASVVDLTAFNDQVRREEEAVALLKKKERHKAQEAALAELLEGTSREELLQLLNGKL